MSPVEHHIQVPRTARYLTEGEIDGAEEVWFILHGYGMLAASFLRWFEPAMRPGRVLVAPEGLSRAYFELGGARRVGASWMTKEDRDAEIEDYVRYLDLLADRVMSGLSESPRVQVHGFSQGTATACRWVAFGRHRPERLVLWGGGVPPDLPLDRYRTALTRARLTLAIGSEDKHIGADEVAAELARLAAVGITPLVHRFDGGHRVDGATLRALDEEE